MKLLMTWGWANENAKEVTKRYSTWKQTGKFKSLYPVSMMVGRNEAFTVVEVDDIAEVLKTTAKWNDICTFEITPIIDSKEAVSVILGP